MAVFPVDFNLFMGINHVPHEATSPKVAMIALHQFPKE
jgi:hypothetical protein